MPIYIKINGFRVIIFFLETHKLPTSIISVLMYYSGFKWENVKECNVWLI